MTHAVLSQCLNNECIASFIHVQNEWRLDFYSKKGDLCDLKTDGMTEKAEQIGMNIHI